MKPQIKLALCILETPKGTFANSLDISSGSALFAKIKTNTQEQKYTMIQKILALTHKSAKWTISYLFVNMHWKVHLTEYNWLKNILYFSVIQES